jgi:hypothetical protein
LIEISRRAALTGAGAGLLSIGCPLCQAKPRIVLKNVLCATQTFSGLEIGEFLKTSGDKGLDASLIAEMNLQSAFFGYRPAFILYSGGEENAAATPEVMPHTPGTDGTILYNIDMLKVQLQVPKWGGAILAGVIAHEFAHIYQNFSKSIGRLRKLHETVKFIELHADFLAGFYMGGKDRAIEVRPYADAFFQIGDYGFSDAAHHGTPQERYFVLKAGYNYRRARPSTSIADASKQGEVILKEYIH